ncbi:cytochrome P450 [Pseudoduganella flava]|uniref:Cytochrome P450 n=1 Tax=Pseudoduganella flava TaxID=871742 RepID=A0A562Q3C6_9BURK|nr:cytochrome P450 [Pseudoduganella flava]QGZ41267.1 cytochrome P450 [Pseudoduganella flava]TWI51204.1 cytochrome P450 [Pseudoduganella flava]
MERNTEPGAWPADPIAAVTHPDPYPWYAHIAAEPKLVYDERLKLWVAAAPTLMREVLAHPDCRVRPVHEPVPAAIAGPAGALFGALARMNEGPRHASPKAALLHALATLDEQAVRACADRVAAPLAAGVADAQTLNAYLFAAPVRTVAALLGWPDERLAQVEGWTREFVACLSPLSSAAAIAASHGAADALLAALRELVRAECTNPGKRHLLAGVLAAPMPDEHTLLANLAGLLSQTYEATAGLLGNCVTALLRDSAADRSTLVERVSRADPAIHNTRRYAACDVDVGGVRVTAGEGILLVLATADGFGHGRHACPGQALATTIVTRALLALPAGLPALGWHYRPSVNARIPVFMEAV